MIIFGIIFILFISACTQVEQPADTGIPDDSGQEDSGAKDYTVKYVESAGKLLYNIVVTKPTPCHEISTGYIITESFPIQVRIDIITIQPPPGLMCVQVVADTLVEGQVELDSKPGAVSIYFNSEKIYSTDDVLVE